MITNILLALLFGFTFGFLGYSIFLYKKIKKTDQEIKQLILGYSASLELIIAEKNRREQHAKALNKLTDPSAIEEEMERGARVREMYDANRRTLPRENAGPPAKVYSPNMRAKVPRSGYKKS